MHLDFHCVESFQSLRQLEINLSCLFCRRENDLSYADTDDAEESNDASGVVANYLGEFICPTCRRISNALMPHFLELGPLQDNPLPPSRIGKRKLGAGGYPRIKDLQQN